MIPTFRGEKTPFALSLRASNAQITPKTADSDQPAEPIPLTDLCEENAQLMTWKRLIPFYVWYVIRWTVTITAGGALAGAIVFPVVGAIAGISGGPVAHILAGIKNIGFLTFVWAPGIAIVLAFDHAYKNRRKRSDTNA